MSLFTVGWANLNKDRRTKKIQEIVFGLTVFAIAYMAILRTAYEALNR